MVQDKSSVQFSVVIPAYNAIGKIEETLESIFTQSQSANEIIVVDDGSTDATATLLGQYSPKLKVIRQDNAGPGVARNTGVAAATCEWVAFCDADDIWHPSKLEIQADTIASDKSLNLLFSNVLFEKNGSYQGTAVATEDVVDADAIIRLLGKEVLFPSTTVVKRSKFEEVGGFHKDFRVGEDIDLMLRLLPRCSSLFWGEPLVTHRIFANSLSRSQGNEKGNLYIAAAYERCLESKSEISTYQRTYARKMLSSYYYDLAYGCKASRRTKYYVKSWQYEPSSITKAIKAIRSMLFDRWLEPGSGPEVPPYRF